MKNLPKGWELSTASEACALVQSGGTPKAGFTEETGIPFLKVYNIVDQRIDFKYRPQFVAAKVHNSELGKSRVKPGDVIMNIVGPPLGKVAIVPDAYPEWNINQALTLFRPSAAVSTEWLYDFLCGGSSVRSVINETRGSAGQVNISLSQCRSFEIPVPPVHEQRRIVAKIDSLSAKSRRARDHLDHIPRLVEKYKQAILEAAFRGDFFPQMAATGGRGLFALKDLCASITDGDHQAPPRAETGIPFITISAMNDGVIDLRKATRFVPLSYFNELKPARRPALGDILYSVTGSIGIPALVSFETPFVFQRHVAILKPDTNLISPSFLYRLLAAPQVREQALKVATGTAQITIPLSGLRDFLLPCPPLAVQGEIVRRIETAFGWVDRLASETASARKLIDRLDQAILAKAFRGELVPQDPNDEPAIVLMERIRAERVAATTATGTGRGRRRTADKPEAPQMVRKPASRTK